MLYGPSMIFHWGIVIIYLLISNENPCSMIEKALATMNQNESYYFQLYPLSLYIVGEGSEVPAPGTTYRFTIFKGQQKFDETKLPIEANFKNINGQHVMVMPKCPINFFVPNFSSGRNAQFIFNLYQTENKTQYFIAQYVIAIEPYIQQYKQQRTVRFEHRAKFSEDYQLEFEVYLQKSRFALEKVVKDYKVERTLKSPLRQRKESPPKDNRKNDQQGPLPQKKKLLREESERSQSQKGQRQSATELSGSGLGKAESRSSSIREENLEQNVEEKPALGKATARTAQEEQSQHSVKRPKSEIHNEAADSAFTKKNKQASGIQSEASSKKQAPSLEVKYRPLTKAEPETKMSQSTRLPQNAQNVIIEEKALERQAEAQGGKEKLWMALFLVLSMVAMYFSMQPSRKV